MGRKGIRFLVAVLLFSGGYFLYAYFNFPPTREAKGILAEVGEGMGTIAGWGMVLLFCRGPLKLLLNEGPFGRRFFPTGAANHVQGVGHTVLLWLNRTHPPLGVITALLIAGHAAFSSRGNINLFLLLTLVVVFWQACFGLFLKSRMPFQTLRRYSYGVHAQLLTGCLILIFTGLGHLLVGD